MSKDQKAAYSGLLPRVRAWFGMSQADLGRYLGLSKSMVSQVERGVCALPLSKALPQAAFTLALQSAPAEPVAEALDAAALRRQQQLCEDRAGQVALEAGRLAERAAWARRRLAALPTLTAVLAPAGGSLPAWLTDFTEEARTELVRSGSTAQALLQVRQAALLAEAAAISQLLNPKPAQ
ncbi:helix-turn-helix domain-containing protein [Hymenobacter sp. BT175]|uniref:helix-turn-helix domain-containing protein n=1 Tax=Hymenobacter translucens TaxID=2886507 RepID=UPI0021D3FC8F|nr:helix-turn-helix transcriptional regulator [Hymenobacter translucens]MCC2546085.1 helix-turn-helix domain-containing protein [Hymenobacter translucens]